MAKPVVVTDEQILTIVILLKTLLGGSRSIRKLLEKIDTPAEIAKIKGAVQELVYLIESL